MSVFVGGSRDLREGLDNDCMVQLTGRTRAIPLICVTLCAMMLLERLKFALNVQLHVISLMVLKLEPSRQCVDRGARSSRNHSE